MKEVKLPEIHMKGWGFEKWIVNNEDYCAKILYFQSGKKCSYHYHNKKREHFFILDGCIRLLLNNKTILLNKGEVIEIPVGSKHSMEALNGDAYILEVSTQHFEEDSVRLIKGD